VPTNPIRTTTPAIPTTTFSAERARTQPVDSCRP
jgi:hypothetical protein